MSHPSVDGCLRFLVPCQYRAGYWLVSSNMHGTMKWEKWVAPDISGTTYLRQTHRIRQEKFSFSPLVFWQQRLPGKGLASPIHSKLLQLCWNWLIGGHGNMKSRASLLKTWRSEFNLKTSICLNPWSHFWNGIAIAFIQTWCVPGTIVGNYPFIPCNIKSILPSNTSQVHIYKFLLDL